MPRSVLLKVDFTFIFNSHSVANGRSPCLWGEQRDGPWKQEQVKQLLTLKCVRGQTAGERAVQDKSPRPYSLEEGLGIARENNFSRSALTGEGLEKTYSCRSPDPFLVAQPKKRCQSPRTVLLNWDLVCITSLKTEKDHELGGAEPHGFR